MLTKTLFALTWLCFGLLLAGCGAGARSQEVDPADVVLRLSDLPRGYRVGDDSGCGPLGGEGATPALRELIVDEHPRGCRMQLEKTYGSSGAPPLVESEAAVFTTVEGARRAFELAPELWRGTITGAPGKPPIELGEETRALETQDALVEGKLGNPGLALIWRQRAVVNAVSVAGLGGRSAEAQVSALARTQDARTTSPSSPSADANDDREVALDNPDLDVDVWWLGRAFSPKGGLPRLELGDTFGPLGPGGGPGFRAYLDYKGSVTLGLWQRQEWERFRSGAVGGDLGRLGRLLTSSACVEQRRLEVAGRDVVLYAAHAPSQSAAPPSAAPSPPSTVTCASGPPNRYYAAVDFGSTIVTINLPVCFTCFAQSGVANPYESEAGIKAVVAGLRRRAHR